MVNSQDPSSKDDKTKSTVNKIADKIDEFAHHEKVEGFYQFTKTNIGATLAYVVLFLGVLLSIFSPFIGGLLVGIIGGIYFGDFILNWILNAKDQIETKELILNLILGGVILGIFVQAPGIVIGAVAVVAVKYLMSQKS